MGCKELDMTEPLKTYLLALVTILYMKALHKLEVMYKKINSFK